MDLITQEKVVPKDVTDTRLDEVSRRDPETQLHRQDNERTSFYNPSVSTFALYNRKKKYSGKRTNELINTKNGIFPPTLQGSDTAQSRTAQLVRQSGAEGYPLPIDGLRLDRESLKAPVTRLTLDK